MLATNDDVTTPQNDVAVLPGNFKKKWNKNINKVMIYLLSIGEGTILASIMAASIVVLLQYLVNREHQCLIQFD